VTIDAASTRAPGAADTAPGDPDVAGASLDRKERVLALIRRLPLDFEGEQG
jgi:hypothetical protein